ncbi:TetR/AcrR family transcriptional regulator [Mycobacterium sp. 21AC1]|uniref:TetR/AcrR family transcriptional regulator n=1 Tax=[Mycobacterium] appelbergii TaxID=2939269 RepID=UPI0029394537|nr:TetR/AcrR family transcriptional regulator [Mycobacterium sp. 21AC1]MDV3128211.1 TetR/AcrR family transcriptional regulator [Mycobacterium sp. 21AC1]
MRPRKQVSLPRGGRRAAIVAVAADLFAAKPYDEIFISDIAEAAGVAHGLLFYHFKDKRGLYLEVLKQVLSEAVALHEARPDETTKAQRLKGAIHRQIEYRRDHAQTSLVLMRPAGADPDIDAIFEQARRSGAEFLLQLLDIGSNEVDPTVRATIRGCMGLTDEMVIDWLNHGCDLPIEQLVDLSYTTTIAVLSSIAADYPTVRSGVRKLRTGRR